MEGFVCKKSCDSSLSRPVFSDLACFSLPGVSLEIAFLQQMVQRDTFTSGSFFQENAEAERFSPAWN